MDLDILIQQAQSLLPTDKSTMRRPKINRDDSKEIKIGELDELLTSANLVYYGNSYGTEHFKQLEALARECITKIETILKDRIPHNSFPTSSAFIKHLVTVARDVLKQAQDPSSLTFFGFLKDYVQTIIDGLPHLRKGEEEIIQKTRDVRNWVLILLD